jgi:glycosyltransferase involved in cell wall biosynthesis
LPGKHIVFIVENLSVPFDRRVWREANSLKNIGYEVSVICPKGMKYDNESEVIINGIQIFRYDIPFTQNSGIGYLGEYLKAFFSTLIIFIKINSNKKVDAIHVANPPEIFFPLGWLGKILGFKFIFDHHDLSPESYLYKFKKDKNDLLYKILIFFEMLTFRSADFIFSTNESIKNIASTRTKMDRNKIAIVRNGPDEKFQPCAANQTLKNGKKYLASYIGVMGQTDGVDNIILAVEHIVKIMGRDDIYFILIGYGDEFANHIKLIKKLEIENYIKMPGRLPDNEVLEILSTSDVCLAPDPANGLNEFHTMNKIMDYMRCGKPIISFDLHESRYSAEEAAIYIENNDVIKFGEGIIFLLNNDEKREKMCKYGMERVNNLLKWELSEKILVENYKRLIGLN